MNRLNYIVFLIFFNVVRDGVMQLDNGSLVIKIRSANLLEFAKCALPDGRLSIVNQQVEEQLHFKTHLSFPVLYYVSKLNWI